MRIFMAAFIPIVFLIPGLVLADIYFYVDEQGIQYYTTRLESIPESYRLKAQVLSLPVSPSAPQEVQPAPSKIEISRIPFHPGSPILVQAKINGAGPITMILDTGADRTLIVSSALGKLGISIENASRVLLGGVTGRSYGSAVWVNSLEVGRAIVSPLLVVVHDSDLKGAEGLLGRDFLANFNVTIDSKEQLVTLAPP
ncbi:MAG: Peptidase retrovirus subgroup [Deltaproteobacteria bacterium]|nr:Peptidase retrovirus subgroup [Deltaproteobacteria bacterium]